MKKIIVSIIIFFQLISFSYTNTYTVDTSDYKYYLRIGSELIDIRTKKKVNPIVKGRTIIRGNKTLVHIGMNLHFYEGTVKKTLHILQGEYLSPDMKYKIVVKENDLYRSDINFSTISFAPLVRLTNLGVFNRGLDSNLWSGDIIIFRAEGGFYHLNTKTKEIKEAPSNVGQYRPVIPSYDNRFTRMYNRFGERLTSYYDIVKNKVIKLDFALGDELWINESTFFVIRLNFTEQNDRGLHYANTYIDYVDFLEDKEENVVTLGNKSNPPRLTNSMSSIIDSRTLALSPDSKSLMFTNLYKPRGFFSYNFDSDSIVTIEESMENTLSQQFGVTSNQDFLCRWTSSEHIIYSKSGNLLDQGTWVFDIHKNKKKITSQIAQKIIVFYEVGKVIYLMGNNKLYISDANGDNIEEFIVDGFRVSKRLPLEPFIDTLN